MYNVIRLIFNSRKICNAESYSIYLRVACNTLDNFIILNIKLEI
jgi:hypothetical protein